MSTDISKKVKYTDCGYDDFIKCEAHYEYQSTSDVFSFHIIYEYSDGNIGRDSFLMSPQTAFLLKEAIEAASNGKMGVYNTKTNRFLEQE